MKTLKLTASDFKQSDSYRKDYIGNENVADFEGNVEISNGLGCVRFHSIKVKGYLFAGARSGIKAGHGIEAGYGIKAGSGIEAGYGIKAGYGIESGLSISCKLAIRCNYRIFAGLDPWKKDLKDEEKTITCKKLESGILAYGILKQTIEEGEKTNALKN